MISSDGGSRGGSGDCVGPRSFRGLMRGYGVRYFELLAFGGWPDQKVCFQGVGH